MSRRFVTSLRATKEAAARREQLSRAVCAPRRPVAGPAVNSRKPRHQSCSDSAFDSLCSSSSFFFFLYCLLLSASRAASALPPPFFWRDSALKPLSVTCHARTLSCLFRILALCWPPRPLLARGGYQGPRRLARSVLGLGLRAGRPPRRWRHLAPALQARSRRGPPKTGASATRNA